MVNAKILEVFSLIYYLLVENDVLFSNDAGILGKRDPSAPIRSRTQDPPTTSSDAPPPSHRRSAGAKAIKLGSWHDKHPAYC